MSLKLLAGCSREKTALRSPFLTLSFYASITAGEEMLDGVLDGIPQMSMEAERQEGKQERRGVIYYSWGHCLLFSVCFSVSFPFPPATYYRIMANELRNKIIREN